MSEMQKGKVKLYACGGGGINIGARFERHRGLSETGFAEIDTVYVDTSRSNLSRQIDQKSCYLMEGLDGSGKIRAENYEEISGRVRDILQQHKPGDVNIVLSTAAGGSGSVIAPSLVSELLDREIPVIVITIGNADTRLEAENTLKTLKSYEAVAKLRKAPVVMAYVQNSEQMPRAKADAHVESIIMALAVVYSRENRELDSKDLFNWLRFDRVTTFGPQLSALTLLDGSSDIDDLGNIISVATVAAETESTKISVTPEYQCVGYIPANADTTVLGTTPLHFVTSDGVFGDVAAGLQRMLAEMEESRSARLPKKSNLLSNTDKPTESGLVL